MSDSSSEFLKLEARLKKCRASVEEFSMLEEQLRSMQRDPRTVEMQRLTLRAKNTVQKSLDLLERELKRERDRGDV